MLLNMGGSVNNATILILHKNYIVSHATHDIATTYL